MASEGGRANVRLRRNLSPNLIADILNDSDFEYSGDDSDEDPEFQLPETDQTLVFDHCKSGSSSSSEDEDDLVISVPSPATSDISNCPSTSSYIPRARGRSRVTSRRQSRGRIRGRGENSQLLSTRHQNNSSILDTWIHEALDTEINNLMQPAYIKKNTEEWEWYQFYEQYVDYDILDHIVTCTNRTQVLETGKSMGLTLKELKVYIGITMIMSALQYPQISMYWSEKWKVPIIAKTMTRNRFFHIRLRLKCVYDPEVTPEQKHQKIWKIQPLFERILAGCHEQDRPQEMSIDEMIIPFSGKCPMRQYCPNKPNPVGLKVFLLASPKGIVCDMAVYQGHTTFPDLINKGFCLGEAAVIHMTRTLVPGHLLFFDRFFTCKCEIYLCFTPNRNCFTDFHENC